MHELDKDYQAQLDALAKEIQASDILAQYLEEEEEEQYLALKEHYEPQISAIYTQVADHHPLQLINFERALFDPSFEGLYLPRLLGHAVLRGEVNKNLKYARPQKHFQDVLSAICNSANFDILRKRIGQSIQMGFALSSDIWVTNLINSFDNKRVRYFLQSQKLDRYRDIVDRKKGYDRYFRQFRSDNFYTAKFPETLSGLKSLYSPVKQFILHRVSKNYDNSSIVPSLNKLIANKEFQGHQEHMEIITLYALFFDLEGDEQEHLVKHFNQTRKSTEGFSDRYFDYLLELHHNDEIHVDPPADIRMAAVVDTKIKDDLSKYYPLMETLHTKGYTTEEVQEAVKQFYMQYEGLSTINECVRQTVYGYFDRFISNLEVSDYPELFEISKLFPVYISIFANQQFNQQLKELCLTYVRKLLKQYTDKRGRDYQDIKKFVATTFQDLGFLKEKEVVEMFKTRRKRKKKAEA